MRTEIEAKFRSADSGPLNSLAAAATLGAANLGPPRAVDELDRYLDTSDGRLAAARWACRLRTRGAVTRLSLKGPQDAGAAPEDWLHRRPEVEGPATTEPDPSRWPSSPARDLLLELAGDGLLIERLRLRQRRVERAVAVDGDRIGLLSLDEVSVEAGSGRLGELHVAELEATSGRRRAETDLRRLAAALAAVPGLAPDPRTKLEHALAMLATASAGG